jgi:hypothetical protein
VPRAIRRLTVDLGVTVAGPAKAWEFAPGLPGLRDVRVGIGLSREGAAEETAT